jgi:hypothetical protein
VHAQIFSGYAVAFLCVDSRTIRLVEALTEEAALSLIEGNSHP